MVRRQRKGASPSNDDRVPPGDADDQRGRDAPVGVNAAVSVRLPRLVEDDPCHDAVRAALGADTRLFWPGGAIMFSVVPFTDALRDALCEAAVGGLLRRGLEDAESALAAERRGLDALPPGAAGRQRARVSRLLVVANDGAERFYRHLETLVAQHAGRVLACMVECDSTAFGAAIYGPGAVAKLVLADHKTSTSAALRALAATA